MTSVAARLASNGLQQHMYAEPTVVAEACSPKGARCVWDSDCCNAAGYDTICEWYECIWIVE
ncbi:hypothetical protein RM555_23695 [Micromonospora sp. DSM 115977]|uniref:Uncharacterized protein n=1 Tax=Micromonospora reichwaldensis TaxID=3075516 RepID=A0ABU2X1E4_9ACTN|nr:hypothetical protein [Micromonospora sp. DSM 115977]MDT0532003.1 hypothetical protein [Micromonospora sp. DSM 115977]